MNVHEIGEPLGTTPRRVVSSDEGTIHLGDPGSAQAIDVIRQKDRVREALGYLPQSFGFHPRVSAERLLNHFAVLKGLVNRRSFSAAGRGVPPALNVPLTIDSCENERP